MRTTRKGNLRKGSFSMGVPDIMKLKDIETQMSNWQFSTYPLSPFHSFKDPLVLLSYNQTTPEHL